MGQRRKINHEYNTGYLHKTGTGKSIYVILIAICIFYLLQWQDLYRLMKIRAP
jgi:hypothetical protein